ncbi:hypothetical protein KAR50_05485 [Periweissella fabaria]|uniref:Uncharacterized protein n=1 Tax=Periweissella fabaria TaxID=546157 RepID=A0ABM8Z4U1_9LACO|nr:hypothetical protein [Periweissella fabaria]MCM0597293.1 hypothetical protein [Periweissella fabaria]CAH0416202.1 hypothetical protein WFA24289_00501 [Periweissella fabaria]
MKNTVHNLNPIVIAQKLMLRQQPAQLDDATINQRLIEDFKTTAPTLPMPRLDLQQVLCALQMRRTLAPQMAYKNNQQ